MPRNSSRINADERAIGARVHEYRLFLKWSQPEFAACLGLTKNQLASVEYGRTPLYYAAAYWLIKRLELNPHWLATGKGMRDDYFNHDELPRPEAGASRVPFSEMMKGAIGMVARKLSDIEQRRMKDTTILDAITAPSDKEFDWIEPLHKLVLRVTDSKQFRNRQDRQRLAQRLYLALERVSNDFYRSQVKAVHQANNAAESGEPVIVENKQLTSVSTMPITPAVKPQLPKLLDRLRKATRERGKASALAKHLDVPKESVSRWIAGRVEPSGEITLQLLEWVKQQGC